MQLLCFIYINRFNTLLYIIRFKHSTVNNYSHQNCPAIINLNQNINNQFYLQNNASTTYYFGFKTGTNTNGGLINSFNGSFIRIA